MGGVGKAQALIHLRRRRFIGVAATPIPKKIAVGPHVYRVYVDADLVEDGDATYGLTRAHKLEIAVHPGPAPSQQRETLLHEVFHAVVADTGFGAYVGADPPLLSKEDEERVISAISPRFLEVLRRNPRFVAYLLND